MYDDDRKTPGPGNDPEDRHPDAEQQPLEFINREGQQPPPPEPEPETDAETAAPAPAAAATRRHNGTRSREQGLSRTMIIVVAVVIAAAAFIFWPRGGGDVPEGIGEEFSIVTRDSTAEVPPPPRSSDVDLDAEVEQITPEAAGAAVDATPEPEPETIPDVESLRKAADAAEAAGVPKTVKQQTPTTQKPAAGTPTPSAEGTWVVQLSAFANSAAAAAEAERFKARGLNRVGVHAGDTPGDKAPHKVQVAFFKTSAEAKSWLDANRLLVGEGPYVVQR